MHLTSVRMLLTIAYVEAKTKNKGSLKSKFQFQIKSRKYFQDLKILSRFQDLCQI